jgi:hypothetical protein
MAIYKIFPIQDATLYSSYPYLNSGLDAICEVSNLIDLSGTPGVSRYLTQFDNDEIKNIISDKIDGNLYSIHLRNFISTAQGINLNVYLEVNPLAQSWNNGTGHYLDSPQLDDGASWYFSLFSGSGQWVLSGSYSGYGITGSYNSNYVGSGGGNWFVDPTNNFPVTQSFGLRSIKDIDLDVTDIVDLWNDDTLPNYGFICKLSNEFEFVLSESIQPVLKYYSVDTNTIYPPCLEFRWRDYSSIPLPPSLIVNTSDLKLSLSENPGVFNPDSINRFYINVSPLYPTRVYQTSSLFTNLNYLPTSSYYAIKDLATNEFIVNFDEQYTQISSDVKGNYFDIYMSGLEPERYYKILIKTTINNSVLIFDDNYYFKVIN